jgi:hypothetical protein
MKTRTTILAAAMSAAMVTSAQADTILFDLDGNNFNGGADKGVIQVDTLDWDAGNAVLVDGVNAGLIGVPGPLDVGAYVIAQSRLTGFVFGGSTAPSVDANNNNIDDADGGSFYEYTYQLVVPVLVTVVDSDGGVADNQVSVTLKVDTTRTSSFNIFADATADGLATSNDNSGCGYGTLFAAPCVADGSFSILSGTVNASGTAMGFSSREGVTVDNPSEALDQFGADGLSPRQTVVSGGTFSLRIDAITRDPDFFITDVTQLDFDVNLPGGGPAPFTATNPTRQVAGHVVAYGTDGVNDYSCGANANEFCDLQVSVDLSTSFRHNQTVPVAGVLPLVSVGLGLLGLAGGVARKRRA